MGRVLSNCGHTAQLIEITGRIMMEFRIADTFTDSLAKLTGDEQKAVKTTRFDLQLNPANPGMSFHKLDKAKDKNFWSVRVSERHPADRPQDRWEPVALLCRPSRQSLPLGRAAEAGNASEDRGCSVGGDAGDGPGNRHPHIRRGKQPVPPKPRLFADMRPTTSCWATVCRRSG